MTDKAMPVLEWLRSTYGGVINRTRDATETWASASSWRTQGAHAACLLRRWLPYLKLKPRQADLAILMEESKSSLSLVELESLREQMRSMNRKGPRPKEKPKAMPGSFAIYADGKWWTMQMGLFQEGSSVPFSETWPRAGGVSNGTAFLRQPSVPLTSVTDSSYSLPTPSAAKYGSNRGGAAGRVGRDRPSLTTMGSRGLLPTPTSTDCKASGAAAYSTESGRHAGVTLTDAVVRRLPTPRACEVRTPGNTERHPSLVGMAKAGLLPTPSARDWKSGGASQETLDRNARPLNEVITSGDASLRLSPRFVEFMMGLPTNWTEIGPTGSISLETESYPKRPRTRGARSRRASGKVNDE